MVIALSVVLSTISQAQWMPSVYNDPYPVYWSVGGPNSTIFDNGVDDVSQWGIRPRNQSQCGSGCTTTGCKPWTQGAFPILKDGQPYNGGVPQAANLSLHISMLEEQVPQWLPDPNYDGLAVLDFESWIPIWDLNSYSNTGYRSTQYQNYSLQLVQQKYPSLSKQQALTKAKEEFETAGVNFFTATLETCVKLRPKAKWGFYGMPGGEGDLDTWNPMTPVWNASTALFPSIYMTEDPLPDPARKNTMEQIVQQSVQAAAAVAKKNNAKIRVPVIPFAWECYHNTSTRLTLNDLKIDLLAPYNAGADAVIVWGYTGFICQGQSELKNYIEYVHEYTGPFVQSYLNRTLACSKTQCSGYGRCSNVSYDSVYDSQECECYAGYTGPNCGTKSV